MELERSSGILLHITSLPSPFGIGDIGPAAFDFIDFLKASGHRCWQILPLTPTHETFSFSPYSSYSAFAGNPLLISPQLLEKEGLVDLRKDPPPKDLQNGETDFRQAKDYKTRLLEKAFRKFSSQPAPPAFLKFKRKHAFWLEDYSLYMALWKELGDPDWTRWPLELRDRRKTALKNATKKLSYNLEKERFNQFMFFSQWEKLMAYAHQNQVGIIGDLPFYVNHHSADCWANSEYFKLDSEKQPTHVSGVPPDFFSETGQLWGTPVFHWKKLAENNYDWWVERIRQNLLLFDILRLDHFRAFSAYWEVRAKEPTAMNGTWKKTPGTALFRKIRKEIPDMPFIAEDLGSLDPPVYRLMEAFKFPGMKVLQFAFGEDMEQNPYIPFNYQRNNLVYSGTHDNNTSRGWFRQAGKTQRRNLDTYTGKKITSHNVHLELHRMALQSVAAIAIIPMQDILGLGEEALMNVPGTTQGNWTWRLDSREIPWGSAEELREMNHLFGRLPPRASKKDNKEEPAK